MEYKLYHADEVKQIHGERREKKQEEREIKSDVAVHNVASWITHCLKKSETSYIKLKQSRVKRKLGKDAGLRELTEYLQKFGYAVRYIKVKEKRWWSRKVFEVYCYVIGYNNEDIEFAFPY